MLDGIPFFMAGATFGDVGAQHLAMLDHHFSWPGQHFVMLAS